ncbi:MAG: hypothetical protein Q9225_008088, partial [Loekoesia sp. 1 TL-2023]
VGNPEILVHRTDCDFLPFFPFGPSFFPFRISSATPPLRQPIDDSQAIINHATTASKLGASISDIADLLPQHSLHLILYPTPEMQIAVARLYACILRFFLSALQWYNDSRATHVLKSIFQPWDIRFRGEYEAVATAGEKVGRLADVALKAEVRDTRLEVVRGRGDWEMVKREMSELRDENRRLQGLLKESIQGMEASTLCESDYVLCLSREGQALIG